MNVEDGFTSSACAKPKNGSISEENICNIGSGGATMKYD